MFRVIWGLSALNALAAAWVELDGDGRRAPTAAAHDIDRRLSRAPEDAGEGREGVTRIDFVPPLGLTFDVHAGAAEVRVLRVWLVD